MDEMMFRLPRWLRPFNIFWRIILVASLLLGARDALRDDPTLLGSIRGLGMLLLMIAFVVVYELFERNETRRSGKWPVPYRTVLIYLIVQLPILTALLGYNTGFFGPLFSLMGHIFSSLPPRRWLVPIGATMTLLASPIGVYDSIAQGDWGALFGFIFSMSSLVGVAAFIGVMFNEHYKREMLIAELRRTKEDLERYASQAEELAALRERARLGRDMHDSLGHALVVVNVKLEAAQRLYGVDRARGDAELVETRALVRETMAELRRSLADLRAPLPDHQDLPAALQRLADETQSRSALSVNCAAPANLPPLLPDTADALWRIAREALTNVEKHAAAGSVDLALERANGSLVLRVADDGSGIAPSDERRPGHYGLVGMRERATALGGTLRIVPRRGGGTVVEARVPLSQPLKELNANE